MPVKPQRGKTFKLTVAQSPLLTITKVQDGFTVYQTGRHQIVFSCNIWFDWVHLGSKGSLHVLANGSLRCCKQRAACRSEAHLAAVPAQDGVAHELLSINLQRVGVLQRTFHAHLLNPLLTWTLPSAHNLTYDLSHTHMYIHNRTQEGGREWWVKAESGDKVEKWTDRVGEK